MSGEELKSIFPEVNAYLNTDRAKMLIQKSGLTFKDALYSLNEVWRLGHITLTHVSIYDIDLFAAQLLQRELLSSNGRPTRLRRDL